MGLYSRLIGLRERFKIARFEALEEFNRQRLLASLIRIRIGFLLAIAALILSSWFTDVYVTNRFSVLEGLAPSVESIRAVLLAIVTGTAAIIAILISISLVVLQMASERYGSRMARFLTGERVAAYVLELLAATLVFGLWNLYLLEAQGVIPYVGVLVSVVLSTVAVSSLATYKGHSLSVVQPSGALQSLGSQIAGDFGRLAGEGRLKWGRSVEAHLRQRVSGRLEDIRELATSLRERGDDEGTANAVTAVFGILGRYARGKRYVPPNTEWFPKRQVAMDVQRGWAYEDMKRMHEGLALGRPTQSQPDLSWLETRCFNVLEHIWTTPTADRHGNRTLQAWSAGLDALIEIALEEQEFSFLDLAKKELKRMLETPLDDLGASKAVFVETVVRGAYNLLRDFDTTRIHATVAGITWRSSKEIVKLRLPAAVQQRVLEYQQRLQVELALEGRVVTPLDWIVEGITSDLSSLYLETVRSYLDWAMSVLSSLQDSALSGRPEDAGSATYAKLLIAHRAVVMGSPRRGFPLVEAAVRDAWQSYNALPPDHQLRTDIFDELRSLSLLAARHREVHALGFALGCLCKVSQEFLKTGNDAFESVVDGLLAVGALAYVVSELDQDPSTNNAVVDVLSTHFNMKGLSGAFRQLAGPQGYGRWSIDAISRYWDHFLPVFQEIRSLPTTVEDIPEATLFHEVLDHPSQFIRRQGRTPLGPDIHDCAEGFVSNLESRFGVGSSDDDEEEDA